MKVAICVLGVAAVILALDVSAQTTLIDEDFQTPMFPSRTANPAFTNWVWVGGNTYAQRSDKDNQVPCDDYPNITNQVIFFEATGRTGTYALTNGWSSNDVYLLSIKASATSYQDSGDKYISPRLMETNGTTLWMGSALLPKYSSGDFGRQPWTPRQMFAWVIEATNFTAGTTGQPIALRVTHTGSGRNIYFDDVLLEVTNSIPVDTNAPDPKRSRKSIFRRLALGGGQQRGHIDIWQ